jgi:hypothetical protein
VQKSPEEIRLELIALIQETQAIFPNLSSRLDEMRRWIANKKPGLLRSKPHVMQLLNELLADATYWFQIQSLAEEDRDAELSELSATEQYWFKHLFPAWINETHLPHLNCHKREITERKKPSKHKNRHLNPKKTFEQP